MLKTVLEYAGLVVLVLLSIAYISQGSIHVKRAIVIDAVPGEVFALINSFENFNRWSPWYERDPDGDYRIEGPGQSVGARMAWASDKPEVGSGSQKMAAFRISSSVFQPQR